jgi:hypothetical protein
MGDEGLQDLDTEHDNIYLAWIKKNPFSEDQ